MKIRKDDTVQVISGKNRGKIGKVLEVIPSTMRVRVEGVNIIKKHKKPTRQGEAGVIIEKAGTVHISNVMLYDTDAKAVTRVGYKVLADGKVRFSHKLNKEL